MLPADVDPETKAPSFVLDRRHRSSTRLIAGKNSSSVQLMPAIERQARVLARVNAAAREARWSLSRACRGQSAGGAPASRRCFLDDLEIEPVPESALAARGADDGPPSNVGPSPTAPSANSQGESHGPGTVFASKRNFLEKRGPDGDLSTVVPHGDRCAGRQRRQVARRGVRHPDRFDEDRSREAPSLPSPAERSSWRVSRGASGALRKPAANRRRDQRSPVAKLGRLLVSGRPFRQAPRRSRRGKKSSPVFARRSLAVRNLEDDVSHLTLGNRPEGDLGLFARAPSGLDMIAIEPQVLGCVGRDPLESYRYMCQRKLMTVRSNLGLLFLGLDSGVDSRRK